MSAKDCAQCGRSTTNAQPWTESKPIPYKANGWVGDTFIPYDRKFKGVHDRRIYLCGICYATKQCEQSREGGEPMTDLEQYLADMAQKETALVVASAASGANGQSKSRVARKPRRDKRPAMTADQARTFDGYSPANTAAVLAALSCACLPYGDVYTYKRWLAQDMQVRLHEKSIRVPLVRMVEQDDDQPPRRILTTSKLFCRCQVELIAEAVAA